MRTQVRALAESWAIQGHDLALGIGIAQGFATLGKIGFEGRFDYAAIGSVTNLAARLCAEAAPWEIIATGRVVAAAGDGVDGDLQDRQLRGFSRPVRTVSIHDVGSEQEEVETR
jgi:adenylate cyclase